MPRLIFVNRFFCPDHSATSQILSDLAFYLAKAGRDVHVVTSTQLYDDAKAALPVSEIINGVHVHRVPSTGFGRNRLLGRSIDYVSFYRSMWQCLVALAQKGDIIVAKTDPPLTSIIALAAARREGARLVNWLQDIYPETAVELGVPFMRGPFAASLMALRNRSLRQAEATVVVGDLMARRVESLGAPSARVHVIANWCHDEVIRPVAQSENRLRQAWGLAGQFVLGYSGNLGRAHEFETMLAAAERLRNEPHFIFLMIGGGKRFEELSHAVKRQDLASSFRFIPYQEQKMLSYSLAVADAHWLSLNPKLEGLIVPSKFYGIAAAGKPCWTRRPISPFLSPMMMIEEPRLRRKPSAKVRSLSNNQSRLPRPRRRANTLQPRREHATLRLSAKAIQMPTLAFMIRPSPITTTR